MKPVATVVGIAANTAAQTGVFMRLSVVTALEAETLIFLVEMVHLREGVVILPLRLIEAMIREDMVATKKEKKVSGKVKVLKKVLLLLGRGAKALLILAVKIMTLVNTA